MSELPATRVYQRIRDEQPAPSGGVARADLYLADAAVDELKAALEERVMPTSSWEKWKQRDAQVEAALLALHDRVKPEQAEARIAELEAIE